eukprot:9483807-Pyramimonas_sp.AAC.1
MEQRTSQPAICEPSILSPGSAHAPSCLGQEGICTDPGPSSLRPRLRASGFGVRAGRDGTRKTKCIPLSWGLLRSAVSWHPALAKRPGEIVPPLMLALYVDGIRFTRSDRTGKADSLT